MDKINRFLECLVPVTACNLKCSYCYVIQEGRRKKDRTTKECYEQSKYRIVV